MCRRKQRKELRKELHVRKQEREYLEKFTMLCLRKQYLSTSHRNPFLWFGLFTSFLSHALLLAWPTPLPVPRFWFGIPACLQSHNNHFRSPGCLKEWNRTSFPEKNLWVFFKFLKGSLKLQTKATCILWLHTFPPGLNADLRNMITCQAP